MNKNKTLIKSDYFYYFLMFFAVFTILSLIIPKGFLSKFNLQSMAFQVPEFGILALGMMITMITQGIDLSIISNANLSGIIAVITMKAFLVNNPQLSDPSILLILIIVSVLSGAILGLVNGIFISYLRIPPILTTLGTMKLYDGISTVITGGQPITGFPPVIARLANETIGVIPISFIIFIIVLFLIYILMERTPPGFSIYMYGENPTASRYSGEPINSILIKTYIISGLMAGVAAVIMMSRFNSVKVGYGNSYLLQTVLVAILGGVAPEGGKGKTLNVVFGILTLQCIASGFNLIGFSNYIRNVIYGSVLIIVMVVRFITPIIRERIYQKKSYT